MENKPIVTCHGDQNLFSRLHGPVVQGLPREPVEWRRSYGRPPRTVYVETNFVPFNPDILPGEDDWTLLGRPFFHMYLTDCDVDTYKSTVKEEIGDWLSILKSKNISDWLIVVVVNDESKVKTKILRQSVFDKVKSDFCNKQSDRCVVLSEPFKADVKSGESWATMLSRMRQLLLQSYNKNLGRFEEYMRTQRERRIEPGWNFCRFFLLQEELAFMFEMLGLFEDSLVQYDELDALFTQFLLNHVAGDTAEWITEIKDNACTTWDGLCLSQPINLEKRQLIKKNKASLLDFRNYLFSRQCTLLFLMFRPWEVAQRSIPFMHNCIQELNMLKVMMPPGSMGCWVFLSCLEVLRTCERFHDSGHMETYSLHTASLWDYARKKMHALGVLCGLMPDLEPSSVQLNMVVELIAGLGPKEAGEGEPLTKLREALSSKDSFRKHYMELSELAMGTFKHIGRIRSARLIGKDLAKFYMKIGEPQKAEGFLMDSIKTYKEEGWDTLADFTRLEIAECQKILENDRRYVKTCMHIAASNVLDEDTRRKFQQSMLEIAGKATDEPIYLQSRPMFLVQTIESDCESFIINKPCVFTLNLLLNLLEPVKAEQISVSIMPNTESKTDQSPARRRRKSSNQSVWSRKPSMSSTSGIDFYNHAEEAMIQMSPNLDITESCELKSDNKTISQCGVVCKTPLHRMDSGPKLFQEADVSKEECDLMLSTTDVALEPGTNRVQLKGKIIEKGEYTLGQLCIQVQGLEFLKSFVKESISFSVLCDDPTILVSAKSDLLIAGLPAQISLVVQSGSSEFENSTSLTFHPSKGLTIAGDSLDDNTLTIPPMKSYEELSYELTIIAELNPKYSEEIQHEMMIESADSLGSVTPRFIFKHPFVISTKLHTASQKKFIQVLVQGSTEVPLLLSNHCVEAESKDVELVAMNNPTQTLVVSSDQSASYLWQLKNNISQTPELAAMFSVSYQQTDHSRNVTGDVRVCRYQFSVSDYKTLLSVFCEVEPPDGSAMCRVGEQCCLSLSVKLLADISWEHLVYEVTAKSSMWAINGKTRGVFTLTDGVYNTVLEAMPLSAGYLPLPKVGLFKYTPPESGENTPETEEKHISKDLDSKSENEDFKSDAVDSENINPTDTALSNKGKMTSGIPYREGFTIGQVYNRSSAVQVHVLPSMNTSTVDVTVT